MTDRISPIHPGEILLKEFLEPLGISQSRLSRDINVPPRRINEIIHGNRAISADTALRLSRYFGLSERFWLNLQMRYDLEVQKDKLDGRLAAEVKTLVCENHSPFDIKGLNKKISLNEITEAIRDSREKPQ